MIIHSGLRSLIATAARFGLVGLANTALGLGVTSTLDLKLNVNPQAANAAGYAVGMVFSYFLSRYFVFQQPVSARSSILKYLATMAIAFAINQFVLLLAGKLLGAAPAMRLLAQVLAMGSYTLVNFILCRAWVFAGPPPAKLDDAAETSA
jgi:putative flippase GtrA